MKQTIMSRLATWKWGAVGALGISLMTAGCSSNGSDTTAKPANNRQPDIMNSTELTGAGATFPYPLYSKWFDAYKTAKGIAINYQPIGSGGGIQQLKARTVDFGASDAPLIDEELAEMPSEVVHIPTVAGSIAIVYNLSGLPKGLKLSGADIANIYLGKIKKWNDPILMKANADLKLPDTTIAVVHRSDGSGTTSIFTSYLKAISPEWDKKVGSGKSVDWPVGLGGKGNDGVTAVVQQTPGGIGYVELAYALENSMSYAALKNKNGEYVLPSVESTTAAIAGALPEIQKDVRAPLINVAGKGAYPIAGMTYILAYTKMEDPQKAKTLTEFLNWSAEKGQVMAKDLYYAPLPPEVVVVNEKIVASIE